MPTRSLPSLPATSSVRRGLTVPALALVLAIAACSVPDPDPSPTAGESVESAVPSLPVEQPNLLLITVDTLRADHLSAWGYPRQTSPRIDSLAAEGVRFERAAIQWPKTGPSFASMFSSTYPKDTGIVRKIGIPVPPDLPLLAESLRAAGYRTRAVVANGALAREFNFHRGFDEYVESWKAELEGGVDPTSAGPVTDMALELTADLAPDVPWFAWIHYLDPHFPYTPPEPWASRFVDDAHFDGERKIDIDAEKPRRQMLAIGSQQVLDGRDELAFYVARYDGEIAYLDHELERLLDGLEARGLLDGTLTVLTSDHGESLGEHHYYFDHGRFGFQTCVNVPFVVHFPGVIEPRTIAEPVELIHLAPTLMELAGIELENRGWNRGRSLLPLLLGTEDPAPEAVAFSEAGYARGGRWQRWVQDRRFKLVYSRQPNERQWLGGRDVPWTLYDLQEDPGETRNVAEDHPEDLRRLRGEMRSWLDDDGSSDVAREATEEMDPETREQLEALGYLD